MLQLSALLLLPMSTGIARSYMGGGGGGKLKQAILRSVYISTCFLPWFWQCGGGGGPWNPHYAYANYIYIKKHNLFLLVSKLQQLILYLNRQIISDFYICLWLNFTSGQYAEVRLGTFASDTSVGRKVAVKIIKGRLL